ncbi:DEAD/DEAH box helicase family protein [Thermodesulfovibrio sp. 3907-1M]|uniref:DEAD/DEAH box helicase family protein n=1 Tax=Thermodesulfovibrio autotrophicus TaxID=3118333 RepID=A0AAU8GWT5_9BACT
MSNNRVISLKSFIEENSKILGETIEKNLTPVWNPGEKIYEKEIVSLLRKPFPVQKELIKGLSKALYKENRNKLFVCGEMGTGKTTIALSVVACSPKPMRTLVVCPTHLVEKWIRETKMIIPNVTVVDLAVKDAITILNFLKHAPKPQKHEVWVISKERAKLSYSWKPAYITKPKSDYLYCPKCGSALVDTISFRPYTKSMLESRKCTCPVCREPLWQAIPKPRRYSVAEYIKKYFKHKFNMLILDEIHDYKGGDTLQGNVMGMLIGTTKYFLGLTGTLSGGVCN